jgi:hypothetical protein
MADVSSSPLGYQAAAPAAVDSMANRRHPLGLPPGSVRAILAFLVFGTVWAMLLLPEEKAVKIPLYLYYLMFLILGHYFAARGHAQATAAPGHHHPLYLPRGSIRILFFVGFAAAFGWGYHQNPNFFDRLNPPLADKPCLPLVVLGTFFLGLLVNKLGNVLLAGPEGLPPWFQDLMAWVSLLAVGALFIEVIIRLVIQPTMLTELDLPTWESILAGLVAFYFGARS